MGWDRLSDLKGEVTAEGANDRVITGDHLINWETTWLSVPAMMYTRGERKDVPGANHTSYIPVALLTATEFCAPSRRSPPG